MDEQLSESWRSCVNMLSQTRRLLRLLRRSAGHTPREPRAQPQSGLNREFRVEQDLIRGKHVNANTHRSILHFSVNKAATQYVKSILTRCVAEEGMVPVHIHEYAFHTRFPYLDHLSSDEMEEYQHVFTPEGYLYSVFGGMIEGIPDLEAYLTVLMVRDPRDVLVSKYYSMAYSHSQPAETGDKFEDFMEERAYARHVSIDNYVLTESHKLDAIYRRYVELLLGRHSGYYLTTYEDMISDFAKWLEDLLDYCQIDPSAQLMASLIGQHSKTAPQRESKDRYLRRGIVGDHRNKLAPHTIETLNDRLQNTLETFGYKP